MPVEVVMPQLGLTMTEGAVKRWLKRDGERVEKGELLFEVTTDKVDMEVEATESGYVQILLEPDRLAPVGTVIARLFDRADAPVLPAPASPEVVRRADQNASRGEVISIAAGRPGAPSFRPDQPRISPRARALAQQLGIDLSTVSSAVPGARIVEADVRRAHAARSDAGETPPPPSRSEGPISS